MDKVTEVTKKTVGGKRGWRYPIPLSRETLWRGSIIPLLLPSRNKLPKSNLSGQNYVGHGYAYLYANPHIKFGTKCVHSFVHFGSMSPNEIYHNNRSRVRVACKVCIIENKYKDGFKTLHINYHPFKILGDEKLKKLLVIDLETAESKPKNIDGTIISISLPDKSGFILIGDRSD